MGVCHHRPDAHPRRPRRQLRPRRPRDRGQEHRRPHAREEHRPRLRERPRSPLLAPHRSSRKFSAITKAARSSPGLVGICGGRCLTSGSSGPTPETLVHRGPGKTVDSLREIKQLALTGYEDIVDETCKEPRIPPQLVPFMFGILPKVEASEHTNDWYFATICPKASRFPPKLAATNPASLCVAASIALVLIIPPHGW